MLRQGGQEFAELRVLGQILLCKVTQREGGENCAEETRVNEKRLFAPSFRLSVAGVTSSTLLMQAVASPQSWDVCRLKPSGHCPVGLLLN